jgi:hypothetical protein
MCVCDVRIEVGDFWGFVSQPYFGQVWGWSPTLGKSEDLESSGTPECSELDSKAQNTSHWGVLGFIERSWSVDVENGLALAIWTSIAQVMGKRRVGSQTGSLTPDHYKSGIDLFLTSESRVRHVVGKDLDAGYKFGSNLVAIRRRSRELWVPKSRDSARDNFGTPTRESRESREKVTFERGCRRESQSIL